MYSPYFLLALAAMSHAWIFPSSLDLAPRSPWRTNLQRRNPPRGTMPPYGNIPDKTSTRMYCPKPDPNDSESTGKPISNVTELGGVQAKAMKFCGAGVDLTSTVNTAGDTGHVFNVTGSDGKPTGPYVQLCVNFVDGGHWTCNQNILSHMLDEIGCGSRDKPTQGFGTLMDDGATTPENYYVWYGNDPPGPCINADTFNKKAWDDVSKYYPKNNDGGDGGGGDATDTSGVGSTGG